MDAKVLGKMLKEARLNKKMTQNEVVGTFITRNMLSQIESGTAFPSVKTLEYLCGVLEIPANNLITEHNDNRIEIDKYEAIRKNYIDGNYSDVISAELPFGFKDEFSAILAKSYLQLANSLALSDVLSDNQKAVEYARKAESIAKEGIFADMETVGKAQLLVKKCSVKLSEYYNSLI